MGPDPAPKPMLTVLEARDRILAGLAPVAAETVSVLAGHGRVLAQDVPARLDQPFADLSAMDGFAVRAADAAEAGRRLRVVGAVPAGSDHPHPLGPGDCVRIFTGAPLPQGADAILIQEDAEDLDADGAAIRVTAPVSQGLYVRPRGLDFARGDRLLAAGRRLTARDIGLAAAADHPFLSVRRRPRVALLATGDEIVLPGQPRGPQQIVSSNAFALAGLVRAVGGEPVILDIAPDRPDRLAGLAGSDHGADLLVTTGGASVGAYDLVHGLLGGADAAADADAGTAVDFWKIAMRPGKPLIWGRLAGVPVLGLPGNPVSALVCGLLFLVPALAALLGQDVPTAPRMARTSTALPKNGGREDYMRATLAWAQADGLPVVTAFDRQDSSMLATLAAADALVIRPVGADPVPAGGIVPVLIFPPDL